MENLTYKINKDRVYFYYGEKLLFQNSKSIPFIVLKKRKNGILSAVSFDKYGVRETEEGYSIEFFNEKNPDDKILLTLVEIENKVHFSFDFNKENTVMQITLYKGRKDVALGLPANNTAEIRRGKTFLGKPITEKIYADKKLSFYIPERYFFENENITDYDVKIKDAVYVSVRSKTPHFTLLCKTDIKEVYQRKDNEKIKKYPRGSVFIETEEIKENQIEKYENKYPDFKGFVIKNSVFNEINVENEVKKAKKKKKEIIFKVDGTVTKEQFFKYFDKNDGFFFDDKYYIDFSKENTARKYLVVIRKYLDLFADGIYFNDRFTKDAVTKLLEGMLDICKEYDSVAVFHNVMTEKQGDYGYLIIKGKDLIANFESFYYDYYYSGEKCFGKEEKKLTEKKDFDLTIIQE